MSRILSDWHTHTVASPDGTLTVEKLCQSAAAQKLESIGISDHCNYNDDRFRTVMRQSREAFDRWKGQYPALRFGVELSPFPKTIYDALAAGKTLAEGQHGYLAPGTPFEPAFALTADEVHALNLDYVIGGVHWRCDAADVMQRPDSAAHWIAEWLRVSLWTVENLVRVAGKERLKILAHPWYSCLQAPWVQQTGETGTGFSLIPYSAHEELASALLQYGVAAECNADQVIHPSLSEKYRREYAEFLRYLHERGIRITYGTDEHDTYTDRRAEVEKALAAVGFRDGDIR